MSDMNIEKSCDHGKWQRLSPRLFKKNCYSLGARSTSNNKGK